MAATAAPASSSSRPGRMAKAGDLGERLGDRGATGGGGPSAEVLGDKESGALSGGVAAAPVPGTAGVGPSGAPRGPWDGGGPCGHSAAFPSWKREPPRPPCGPRHRHRHAWPRSLGTPGAAPAGNLRPFWGEKPPSCAALGLARPSLAYAAAGPARGATPAAGGSPPPALHLLPTPEPPPRCIPRGPATPDPPRGAPRGVLLPLNSVRGAPRGVSLPLNSPPRCTPKGPAAPDHPPPPWGAPRGVSPGSGRRWRPPALTRTPARAGGARSACLGGRPSQEC